MQQRVTKGLILILMGLIVLLHLSLEKAKRPDADPTDRKEQELQSRQKPNIVRMKIEEIRARVTLREIQERAKKEVRISKEKPKRSPIRAPKPRKRNKKKPILTATVSVSDNLIKQGLSVIGQKGEMIGQFPSIVVHYRKTLGFKTYVESIHKLGGRFFILDTSRRRLVSEIDFGTRSLRAIRNLQNLSPRSRDISGETALYRYHSLATAEYGQSHYSVVLLFPLIVDSFLIAGIDDSLRKARLDIKGFSLLEGEYQKRGSALILKIRSGKMKDGSIKKMDIELNLSGV